MLLLLTALIFLVGACSLRPEASRQPALPQGSAHGEAVSESAYLALRDSYARRLTVLYRVGDTATLKADSLAIVDLDRHIRPIIGPVAIAGFPDSAHFNVTTLMLGDVDSGLADGLIYESRDGRSRVFVTTQEIFRGWIAYRFAGDSTVPRDPLRALTKDQVYTAIFEGDAAVFRYADLPVTSSRKQVIAAMLVNRAQDYCLQCTPGNIILSVRAGDRIFVMDAPARDTIPVPAQCTAAAASDTLSRTLFEAYRRSGLKDTSLYNQSTRAEDEQFAEFLRCYGRTVSSNPRFSQLVAQARELVDALPAQ